MVKIVIVGSCRFSPYEVLVPSSISKLHNTEEGYQKACETFYPAIQDADVVIAYVPDGLGEHTLRDLQYAVTQKKRIIVIGKKESHTG